MDQKMSNLIALALEPEYEGSFASYRIIEVANISVGSSLPYYRYVGIKEKTKVSIEVSNKEYDGNPIHISISGSPSYKIEWYSNGVKLNAAPKDAGLYKAIVTVYEDSDYLGFVSELIVSIEKATPNISVSYIGDALTTQSIKPDASMFAVIGMDGTLELDVADLKEGNITVSYKFIPADRINYNEVKELDLYLDIDDIKTGIMLIKESIKESNEEIEILTKLKRASHDLNLLSEIIF